MDVEAPEHLERLRALSFIKAACLVHRPSADSPTALFERAPRNAAYRPPIQDHVARILDAGVVEESSTPISMYDQSCLLLTLSLKPGTAAPFVVAVIAAGEGGEEKCRELLLSVSSDYWFGSRFFK